MDAQAIGSIMALLTGIGLTGWQVINKLRVNQASTSSEVGHLSRMDREAERHEKRIAMLERRVRLLERRDAMLVALCLKHDIDVIALLKEHGLEDLAEEIEHEKE